jgi:hypothetical protein
VTIRVFPAEQRLAKDVGRAVGQVAGSATDAEDLLVRLQNALRAWYPRMTIHERLEFGALDGAEPLWYALRDGRIHPDDPRKDRLHAALATARDMTEEASLNLDRARVLAGVGPQRRPDEGDEDSATDAGG